MLTEWSSLWIIQSRGGGASTPSFNTHFCTDRFYFNALSFVINLLVPFLVLTAATDLNIQLFLQISKWMKILPKTTMTCGFRSCKWTFCPMLMCIDTFCFLTTTCVPSFSCVLFPHPISVRKSFFTHQFSCCRLLAIVVHISIFEGFASYFALAHLPLFVFEAPTYEKHLYDQYKWPISYSNRSSWYQYALSSCCYRNYELSVQVCI